MRRTITIKWVCAVCGRRVTADEVGDISKEKTPDVPGGYSQVVKCKACVEPEGNVPLSPLCMESKHRECSTSTCRCACHPEINQTTTEEMPR